ncbi:hypothetical protein KIN20_004461 [Parelaphostrongylus tenuis]|uniref:Uncharacterized protein n=1 Tax=Parelaphostrongylus tenuis TaxID=148309 RepID=A0AAD5MRD6_PARTN|nr:hypothetical protein KIN20_004461 [Parelaphostrongylus tenuis]
MQDIYTQNCRYVLCISREENCDNARQQLLGTDPKVLSEIQQFRRLFITEKSDEVTATASPDISAIMNTERLVNGVHSTLKNCAIQPDPSRKLLADLQSLLLDESTCRGRLLIVERLIELLHGIKTVVNHFDISYSILLCDGSSRKSVGAFVDPAHNVFGTERIRHTIYRLFLPSR